jgi:hypothetical protein
MRVLETAEPGAIMSFTLAEALGQVDLEAGSVYRCRVKGQWVELRVLGPAVEPPPTAVDESDVMLDPWIEFPPPAAVKSVAGRFAAPLLPDVPEIPSDEADS